MPREQTQGYGINSETRLPRSDRGPVERVAFARFASIFLGVTVLVHLIIDDNEVDPTQSAKGIAN